ncbi:MAG: HepT-like ribonuclease domain-containing protein, partial [Pseudomonadota bacterium]
PEVPWRLMIATRNRLIHGYLGIDDDVLWTIIQDDIPSLLAQLRALKGRSP